MKKLLIFPVLAILIFLSGCFLDEPTLKNRLLESYMATHYDENLIFLGCSEESTKVGICVPYANGRIAYLFKAYNINEDMCELRTAYLDGLQDKETALIYDKFLTNLKRGNCE